MKILYADDNATNCHLIDQLMTATGHRCITVNNGLDALEKLRQETFDVVLSDILMPQMDGFQLCREVRHDPEMADVPFVFYTATYTDGQDRDFALSLGADDFLIKPIENQQLVKVLERAAKRGEKAAPAAGAHQPDFYEVYSQRLVERLECKLVELAEKNSQLRQEAKRRERAEAQSREALTLFKATFDSTGDGQLVVIDGQVVAVNGPFLELWNFETEEQVPETWPLLLKALRNALLRPDTVEALENVRKTKPTDPSALEQGLVLELKQGKVLTIRRQALPIECEGEAQLFCFQDITQERAVQATRRDLQRQIAQSQKMESLGVMAASIAHDFNNLLTVIWGSAQILEEFVLQLDCDRIYQDSVRELRLATGHSIELVARIVRFSRSKTQGLRLGSLGAAVREGAQLLSLLVPPTMELHIRVAPTDRMVLLDPIELQQIVLNLGANAVSAMSPGGQLTVEVASEQQGVVLRVTDTGAGIEPSQVPHIFEPFFTTKPEGKGTGLGLATVQRIVTNHGAAIDVVSTVGSGTSVSILFPEASGDHAAVEIETATSGRLLLIERDAQGSEQTERVLVDNGYKVDVAISERSGVQQIEASAEEYSVVIIDDPKGAEAGASELSRVIAAVAPSLPIVVLAEPFGELDVAFARSAAHNNVLLKPWSDTELLSAITRAVQESLSSK